MDPGAGNQRRARLASSATSTRGSRRTPQGETPTEPDRDPADLRRKGSGPAPARDGGPSGRLTRSWGGGREGGLPIWAGILASLVISLIAIILVASRDGSSGATKTIISSVTTQTKTVTATKTHTATTWRPSSSALRIPGHIVKLTRLTKTKGIAADASLVTAGRGLRLTVAADVPGHPLVAYLTRRPGHFLLLAIGRQGALTASSDFAARTLGKYGQVTVFEATGKKSLNQARPVATIALTRLARQDHVHLAPKHSKRRAGGGRSRLRHKTVHRRGETIGSSWAEQRPSLFRSTRTDGPTETEAAFPRRRSGLRKPKRWGVSVGRVASARLALSRTIL